MHICFTGPRKISYSQGVQIAKKIGQLEAESWHVGDASGTDATITRYLTAAGKQPKIYRAEGRKTWQLATRSKAMVDGCAKMGDSKLIAFPNKPCPDGVKPAKSFSGKGSGTWGTVAYAYWLGLEIELIFLEKNLEQPDWMGQLSLF